MLRRIVSGGFVEVSMVILVNEEIVETMRSDTMSSIYWFSGTDGLGSKLDRGLGLGRRGQNESHKLRESNIAWGEEFECVLEGRQVKSSQVEFFVVVVLVSIEQLSSKNSVSSNLGVLISLLLVSNGSDLINEIWLYSPFWVFLLGKNTSNNSAITFSYNIHFHSELLSPPINFTNININVFHHLAFFDWRQYLLPTFPCPTLSPLWCDDTTNNWSTTTLDI